MTQYVENVKVLPLKTVWKRDLDVAEIKIPALAVVNQAKKEDEIRKSNESKIPFDKWNLPPQPEGYIKYCGYDFF